MIKTKTMTLLTMLFCYLCVYTWDKKQQRKNKYVRGKKYTYKK